MSVTRFGSDANAAQERTRAARRSERWMFWGSYAALALGLSGWLLAAGFLR